MKGNRGLSTLRPPPAFLFFRRHPQNRVEVGWRTNPCTRGPHPPLPQDLAIALQFHHPQECAQHSHPLPPPPPPLSLSLTQSLLPHDGHTQPIDLFSLPDLRYISSRSRRKFHDPIWTLIWLAGLSICVISSLLSLFLTHILYSYIQHRFLSY